MGSKDVCHLKWKDFHTTFSHGFSLLLDDLEFTDITLSTKNRSYQAHKVVLSVSSPYFKTILKSNPCKHPVLIFNDIPDETLQWIIEFMYNGAVNIPTSKIDEFLAAAQTFKIQGLSTENEKSDEPDPKRLKYEPITVSETKTNSKPVGISNDEDDVKYENSEQEKGNTFENFVLVSNEDKIDQDMDVLKQELSHTEYSASVEMFQENQWHEENSLFELEESELSNTAVTMSAKVTTTPQGMHKCPDCDKLFTRQCSVLRHIKEVHFVAPPELWPRCSLCQKRFKNSRNLSSHYKKCSQHFGNFSNEITETKEIVDII